MQLNEHNCFIAVLTIKRKSRESHRVLHFFVTHDDIGCLLGNVMGIAERNPWRCFNDSEEVTLVFLWNESLGQTTISPTCQDQTPNKDRDDHQLHLDKEFNQTSIASRYPIENSIKAVKQPTQWTFYWLLRTEKYP